MQFKFHSDTAFALAFCVLCIQSDPMLKETANLAGKAVFYHVDHSKNLAKNYQELARFN